MAIMDIYPNTGTENYVPSNSILREFIGGSIFD
jgi:hypothetical protein